jgi:hypothetical protein
MVEDDLTLCFKGTQEQLLTCYKNAEACLKPGQRSADLVPLALCSYIKDHTT